MSSVEAKFPNWQPIETAPRDGETILLFAEVWEMTWGSVLTGHFEGDGEGGGEWVTAEGAVNENDPDFDPDAACDDEDWDDECNLGPTHWMPLPDGPARATGESQ